MAHFDIERTAPSRHLRIVETLLYIAKEINSIHEIITSINLHLETPVVSPVDFPTEIVLPPAIWPL